jgi:hypothetical protein
VGRSWIGDAEPAWFYELAEVVHQFIEHNGDIPVLAADEFFSDARRHVERTVELVFLPPNRRRSIEVDIAASEGHRLWLGEAATDLRPDGRRLKTLRRLAFGVEAYGLLFATGRERFPNSVLEAIHETFSRHQPVVSLMAGIRAET